MKGLFKKLPTTALCLVTFAIATPSYADPIPYANPGTANPDTYTFTAANTGNVVAYFVGQTAGYGSMIGLSINGAAPLVYGLQNHLSAVGDSFVMGSVNAGDTLRFVMQVSSDFWGPPPTAYYLNSDASLNAGGENFIYSSIYAGDLVFPAGTYMGFEDISPLQNGDLDYDDHQFVFTNVQATTTSVPDGASTLLLLGLVTAGLAAARRRVAA